VNGTWKRPDSLGVDERRAIEKKREAGVVNEVTNCHRQQNIVLGGLHIPIDWEGAEEKKKKSGRNR